ncbi:MAG TPA: ATP-binding cassette domain-containing protein [Rhodospirillaceae bacterium]|nr:ATP-binding cassette domain-containing protein [Rhodospirillaceae bacterium]
MTLLEAKSLVYAYPGGVPALRGLDLRIQAGRRLAILGPNGSGKTTLLLHLNGTLRPSTGRIVLEGEDCGYSRSQLVAWRRRIGLVFQDAEDQLFAASVAEDVSFGPLNLGMQDDEVRQRVDETLVALGIQDLADRPTHMLSFGQKKRVALAGAVAMRPQILMLDEPTAGLDQKGSWQLLEVLTRLESLGTTLVFTTHDVDLAYSFAHDVALFKDGKVLVQGVVDTVLADAGLLARVELRSPFLMELGLKARALGLLADASPLPRNRDEVLNLFGPRAL